MHFKAATTTKVMCIFALQNKSHTTYISFIQEKSAKLFFFPEVLVLVPICVLYTENVNGKIENMTKFVNCAHIS